jgi:hypothetical protein
MALIQNNGIEVSQDFYKALRSGNKVALNSRHQLREVLEVRPHKRAYGFSLQERARGKL